MTSLWTDTGDLQYFLFCHLCFRGILANSLCKNRTNWEIWSDEWHETTQTVSAQGEVHHSMDRNVNFYLSSGHRDAAYHVCETQQPPCQWFLVIWTTMQRTPRHCSRPSLTFTSPENLLCCCCCAVLLLFQTTCKKKGFFSKRFCCRCGLQRLAAWFETKGSSFIFPVGGSCSSFHLTVNQLLFRQKAPQS